MAINRRTFARSLAAAGFAGVFAGRSPAQVSGTFPHGVASGDPLLNRVILWTRVSPASPEDLVPVE